VRVLWRMDRIDCKSLRKALNPLRVEPSVLLNPDGGWCLGFPLLQKRFVGYLRTIREIETSPFFPMTKDKVISQVPYPEPVALEDERRQFERRFLPSIHVCLRKENEGRIYFLECSNGLIKIGRTRGAVNARAQWVQRHFGVDARVITSIPVTCASRAEQMIHGHFGRFHTPVTGVTRNYSGSLTKGVEFFSITVDQVMEVVDRIAGHKNPSPTARYDRRTERAMQEALARIS